MDLCVLLKDFAHRQGVRLSPDWSATVENGFDSQYLASMNELFSLLGWQTPIIITGKPRVSDFPFLVYDSSIGWAIAEQWIDDKLRVSVADQQHLLDWRSELTQIWPVFPEQVSALRFTNARQVFWSCINKRKRMMVEAVIATVVLSFLSLVTSLYSMQVYDRVVPHSGFATLWVLTGGVAIGLVIDLILRTTRSMMVDRETAHIDAEVSEYFFSRMQDVRLDARPKSIGTMAAQLRGLDQIRQTMTSTTLLVLADLPFALFFVAIIASLGGAVALVPLIVFLFSICLSFFFARLIREKASLSQSTAYSKNGLLVESLDAAETIKANLGGWFMLKKWVHLVEENNSHDMSVRRWSVLATSVFGFLQQVAYIGMVAWGAYKISQGEMTMGGLIACTIIGGRVNGTLITSLPGLIVQWSYTRSSLDSLDEILELPSDHPHDRQLLRIKKINPHLKIENAKFVYPGTRAGLDIPSLELRPGERVGLIGPVGSGKSSLLRMLAGLYAPVEGYVFFDGMDVRHISEDDVRRDVGYLPQEYRLVQGSLRENLMLGLPHQSDDKLMEYAEKTGLAQVIKTHPKGLDLPLTEGGQGLSGGQRALVGLTRLLLAKPRLVLLDEPTANLDQETELRVLNAIVQNLTPESTLVFVTHRMQLLGIFTRLVVMGQGRILLDGPTKEVVERLQSKSSQVVNARQSATVPTVAE